MRTRTCLTLYNYWNAVRAGRLAPRRFDIEPSQITAVLQDALILEKMDERTYRFRLAGTRVCETFATEFRGRNLLEGWRENDTFLLRRHMTTVSSLGAVATFVVTGQTADGSQAHFEMVLLPLLHSSGSLDRFLGGLAPIDAPDWLGRRAIIERRLTAHELIWPDGRPGERGEAPNEPAPFRPLVRNARLVRSDRRSFRVYEGGLSKKH